MLDDLRQAILGHRGEFLCQMFSGASETQRTKGVPFVHRVAEPELEPLARVPDIGDLRAFYATFGSVLFYYDERSGDAARWLAPIAQWDELRELFDAWFDGLGEDERAEILPDWAASALVVGETPQSGNYILIPTTGEEAGHVYEFDHDGYEFIHLADGLADYAWDLLDLDSARLTDLASHMSFIEGDPLEQWWILELRDNRGRVVQTLP